MQDAYIPKDASNGKQGHRGFGFVTFANADDVDKVLQCAHTIRQTDLAVQCAVPKVIFMRALIADDESKPWSVTLHDS